MRVRIFSGRALWPLLCAVLTAWGLACLGVGDGPGPAEIAADSATRAPRPDEATATFHFPGNMPEQREFVWRHEDGSYDYAERWDGGVPGDEALQIQVGWDWKVDCRIHIRALAKGACCYQECRDGGDSGLGREPPDRFGCMNEAAGGRYQWFLDGLLDHGMSHLEACSAPQQP